MKLFSNKKKFLFPILFLFLLLVLLLTGYYLIVHGKIITVTDKKEYGNYEKYERLNNLAVFPDKDMEMLFDTYFYQYHDLFYAPCVQIILEAHYTKEQFTQELLRLEELELTYSGQTNHLFKDNTHFLSTAYVAMADWNDSYEYALVFENLHTILYVYLENADSIEDLHVDNLFLPTYYEASSSDNVSYSFYAFPMGDTYRNCTNLYQKY